MRIYGELSATFNVDKVFNIKEFIKGCDLLSKHMGHNVTNINSNKDCRNHIESIVELKSERRSIEVWMKRLTNDNKIYSVTVLVHGEDLTSDYLNNAITLAKSSFQLDEIITNKR